MHSIAARWAGTITVLGILGWQQVERRLNPVVELLEQKQPVFGLYAPSNRRGARSGDGAAETRTPAELAREALAYRLGDYVFDGSMEHDFDGAFPAFGAFVQGMVQGGAVELGPLHDNHHAAIDAAFRRALAQSRAMGIVAPRALPNPILGWPVRLRSNSKSLRGDSNYYFVDQGGKDFSCTSRTYGGHRGTDFVLFPFWWTMMEGEEVEVIAAAPGATPRAQAASPSSVPVAATCAAPRPNTDRRNSHSRDGRTSRPIRNSRSTMPISS